jgi:hypothetical protein
MDSSWTAAGRRLLRVVDLVRGALMWDEAGGVNAPAPGVRARAGRGTHREQSRQGAPVRPNRSCAPKGPVGCPAGLSVEPEFRRGTATKAHDGRAGACRASSARDKARPRFDGAELGRRARRQAPPALAADGRQADLIGVAMARDPAVVLARSHRTGANPPWPGNDQIFGRVPHRRPGRLRVIFGPGPPDRRR